jgi:DNA-binding transcriptional LysR family regulator
MDRLDAMSIVVAVVESGSLSAASRRLRIPLPTVSRKISDLEAHLGTRLLIRSTRKLVLTEAGADYVAASRRILEEVGEAERAASGEYSAPRGDLIITAPVVLGRMHLLPAVTEFLAKYPEIDVRLVLSDRYMDLIGDHIDLALRVGPLPDSSLVATRLGVVRPVVCGSPSYFAAHGVPRTPAELAKLTAVTFDVLGSVTSWDFYVPELKAVHAVRLHYRLSVNTAESAIDAAIVGVGVTRVLSYQVARAIKEGKLQTVLSKYEVEPLPVNFVHGGQGLLPLKVRAFLDFAAPRIRARLLEKKPTESTKERRARYGNRN